MCWGVLQGSVLATHLFNLYKDLPYCAVQILNVNVNGILITEQVQNKNKIIPINERFCLAELTCPAVKSKACLENNIV